MLASWGEIVVVLGVGAVLYGPKDLPRVAYAAGRAVGNTVAFLKKARSGLDSFAKEHELLQLHHDVRKSLMELNSIRSEIQQAGSIMPPPMYGQAPLKVLPSAPPLPAHVAVLSMAQQQQQLPAAPNTHAPHSRPHTLGSSTRAAVSAAHPAPAPHAHPPPKHIGGGGGEGEVGAGVGHGMGGSAQVGVQERAAGEGGAANPTITYGAPSSEAAVMFAPKTDSLAGGADHLIELMLLRERMHVKPTDRR